MTLNPCPTLVCRQNTVYSLGIFIGVAEQVSITHCQCAYFVNYNTFTCLPLVVEALSAVPFASFFSLLAVVMRVEQHLQQCTLSF